MATKTFTVDRSRLERYRAEADAALGASRSASDRLTDARFRLREAKDELQRWERALPGEPRIVNVRDDKGNLHRQSKSQNERYLASARARVEAAQAEVNRLAGAQKEGAAARENATQLFAKLDAYAKEHAR